MLSKSCNVKNWNPMRNMDECALTCIRFNLRTLKDPKLPDNVNQINNRTSMVDVNIDAQVKISTLYQQNDRVRTAFSKYIISTLLPIAEESYIDTMNNMEHSNMSGQTKINNPEPLYGFSSKLDQSKTSINKNSITKITADESSIRESTKSARNLTGPLSKHKDADDPENLSESQIQMIIEMKMQKLDKFNNILESKSVNALIKKYKLTQESIEKLKRLQARIRTWVLKRRFFRALRMNHYIEHRKNYLSLKKCVARYERLYEDNDDDDYLSDYFRSIVNIFNDY